MPIRSVQPKDFAPLADLYKGFFPIHTIFQQKKAEVLAYLEQRAEQYELLVAEEKGKVQGALFLVNCCQNADGSHKLWKFQHVAFQNEKVALALLQEAKKRIKKQSKTVKIELHIAETEKEIGIYKKQGYQQEGVLTNHYRWGEKCVVLGKSL